MLSYYTLLQLDLSLLPSDLSLGQFKHGSLHLPEQGRERQQLSRACQCLHCHIHRQAEVLGAVLYIDLRSPIATSEWYSKEMVDQLTTSMRSWVKFGQRGFKAFT